MNFLHYKKLFVNAHFNQPNVEKKELCVDNKVRETIGDVYFPTCRYGKVHRSTIKTSSFYECKKFKACCYILYILFKDKKPNFFGGDDTQCFVKETSCDDDNEKSFPF